MKTNVRNGKIARLPRTLRNELNQRLADGVPGTELVRWLNGLAEVKAVLQAQFAGKAVSEQNLSEWKGGGYEEWLAQREVLGQARDLADQAADWRETAGAPGALGEHLAGVLTVRYAGALAGWQGEASEGLMKQLRLLHVMTHDVARLARVGLERQRVEAVREKSQGELVALFKQWLELPAVSEAVRGKYADPEDRNRAIAQVFGDVYPGDEGKTRDEIEEEIRLKNEVCRCRRGCRCLAEQQNQGGSKRIKPRKGAGKSSEAGKHSTANIQRSTSNESLADHAGAVQPDASNGGAFVGDPLMNQAGRERWLKDPTGCDAHGEDKVMTDEEKEKAIRQVYGMPEEDGVEERAFYLKNAPGLSARERANLKPEAAVPGAEMQGNPSGSNPIKPVGQGQEPNPAHFTKEYWTKERVDKLEAELAAADDPQLEAKRKWKKENHFE